MAWKRDKPTPGWHSHPRATATALANPRPPAVPASLNLTHEEYYAAAALMGILSAQGEEPDVQWASALAHDMGEAMAAESRKRSKKK